MQVIAEVLEEYDAGNFSSADARAIVEAFRRADINPGQALAGDMSTAGFDAKEVGGAAVSSGDYNEAQLAQSQSLTLNITDQMLQELNQLLGSFYIDKLSDEDRKNTLTFIREIFEQTASENGLINVTA
ncbi:MAG: hypothetical protein V7708_06300 [Oceanicoccus sp.]